eukprot:TRINITY_DN5670_c0_g1_i3.p1 TRINITY_DN5670_c0_g1~~TRINITY_DN5670_c0_g1_i3.p1  ORF type:complete len:963 (-),score=347.27 TRINITY_DN5670_c0_g1_i3:168-3056(-)
MSSVNVRVVVRIRPKNKKEEQLEKTAVQSPASKDGKYKFCMNFNDNGKSINVGTTKLPPQDYHYDAVFGPGSTQEEVYEDAARAVIEDILDGYNGTIFAYGQTGSGKTHTMFGPRPFKEDTCGIVPRATSHIFDHINSDTKGSEYTIQCSYVEIYREVVQDLLDPTKSNLAVRETPTKGIYIEGVTAEFVSSEGDIMDLLAIGDASRRVASTNMNEQSSRSHSLFIITVQQKDDAGSIKTGKLNLVDLAGSEKIQKTGAKGETLEEAKKINQSLSALGNCIKALTDSKRSHVPYRDSKLTRILQESLGGNTKTTLMVAASPAEYNVDETISSLKFAQRAKTIKTTVRVNKVQSAEELQALVASLRKELQALKKYCAKLEKMIPADKRPRRTTVDAASAAAAAGIDLNAEEEDTAGEGEGSDEDEDDDEAYDPLELAELRMEMERMKEEYRIEMEDLQQAVIVLGESEAEAQAELESVRAEKQKLELQQKKARTRSSTVEQQTAASLKRVEFELENKAAELEHALKENEALVDQKMVIAAEMSALEKNLEQLQDAEAAFKQAAEKKEHELAQAHKQVADLEGEVAREKESLAAARRETEEVKGQLEVANKEKDNANTTIAELRSEVQQAKLEKVDLQTETEKKAHEVAMLEQEVSSLKAKLDRAHTEAQASVKAVESEGGDKVAAEQARTKAVQEELERVQNEKSQVDTQLMDAQAEKSKISLERDNLQQSLESAQADLKTAQGELEALRAERDQVKETSNQEIERLRTQVSETESQAQNDSNELREKLRVAEDDLTAARKEIAHTQSSDRKLAQELASTKSALESEKSRASTLQEQMTKQQGRLVQVESLLASLNGEVERIQSEAETAQTDLAAANTAHADEVKQLQATIVELQAQIKKLSTRGTVRKPVRLRGGETSSVLDAYRAKVDLKEHISGLRQVDSKAAQEIARLRAEASGAAASE